MTAILIDGENIAAKHYPTLEKFIQQIGQAQILRVFGDFSNGSHEAWLGVCKDHAIEPILHLPVGTAKNGTDMAITICAMDIMASHQFGTIVIASDDCDFIPLVRRLRSEGIQVHGVGLKAATKAAKVYYNSWTILKTIAAPVKAEKIAKTAPKIDPLATKLIKLVHEKLSDRGETLSTLGSWIGKQHPTMKSLLGPGKLKKLLIADGRFKIEGLAVSLANQR